MEWNEEAERQKMIWIKIMKLDEVAWSWSIVRVQEKKDKKKCHERITNIFVGG